MTQENATESAGDKKRASIKTVDSKKLEAGVYEATFKSGEVVTCDINAIPEAVREAMLQRFLAYGLKQKMDDSIAGEPLETAPSEMQATWDAICKGAWVTRTPGDGVEGGLFARAYAERHGIPLGDAKAHIGTLVEKNLAANVARQSEEERKKNPVTARAIFNKIRDTAIARDEKLSAIYEDLKAKQKAKAAAKPSTIEIALDDPK